MKRLCAAIAATLMLLVTINAKAQHFSARGLTYLDPATNWVEETMKDMTLEQRIAQLMIVRVPLNMDDKRAADFSTEMNGYGVGGLCFFAGTAERQVSMTRQFQKDAAIPLLITIDAEWGLGMRLKDMYSFPRNKKFGFLTSDADSIVYRMGEEIGRQCREMGIHINYAPVVDINSNPMNPVIGSRSFGLDPERVAQLGIMYANGQQSQGVLAVAKHFPGHGDTETDSHFELPVINHTREYMDTIDLYPFRRMIEAGVGGVMAAHLRVNAYDNERPSSLSPILIDSLLHNRMGFKGLTMTDGLDMKGVTNTYSMGTGELAALKAGHDILLLPPNVPQAIETIKTAAVQDEKISDMIDYHCRRVLRAKYDLVLPHIEEEIKVPGKEHKAVCQAIVADLNINIDTVIDSIVHDAIAKKAMPGCQIVVIHKGHKVLDRCYGNLTYDTVDPVTPDKVYDIASLTKVTATTLAIMKLYDEKRISINDKLSRYLPYLKNTDKENITVKQAMSHCAGLKAFDAYWKEATNYDSILQLVTQSPLTGKKDMLYSDLGFMLLSDVVHHITGMPLDLYVAQQFYEPMGLVNTTFNPLNDSSFDIKDIAPTETDTLRGVIRGIVHDPNANAMGGVSGHAGLFSNADDVAQLMQMLLNGGQLYGQRYLKEATINEFTSRHFEKEGNRRALGFDKQLFTPSAKGQTCPEASQRSFGHTGFTGTMAWVDPDYDLVYIFLSNRVYPSATPNKLAQMNVRTKIQSEIYKQLK